MIRLRLVAALAATSSGAVLLAPTEVPATSALEGSEVLATEVAAFGLRAVGAVLCAYLGAVLLAVLLTELRVLPTALRRWVDRWTSSGVAGAVRHLVGATALATGFVPLAPTLAHATEAPAPVMAPTEDVTPATEPPPATTSPPRMVPVEEPPPPTSTPTTTPPRPPSPPAPRIDLPPSAARHPSQVGRMAPTHVVRAGQSFWSIAEDLVALRLGRAPTEPEVIGPWLELIARNTHVLADPSDPDLLDVGVVLHLPPERRPR